MFRLLQDFGGALGTGRTCTVLTKYQTKSLEDNFAPLSQTRVRDIKYQMTIGFMLTSVSRKGRRSMLKNFEGMSQ